MSGSGASAGSGSGSGSGSSSVSMPESEYDFEIILEEGSPDLEYLRRESGLLRELGETTPLTLSEDILFGSEPNSVKKKHWEDFVDIFFPYLTRNPYFIYNPRTNSISVNPVRGTTNSLKERLDFFMVRKPATMLDFARDQARMQLNKGMVGVSIRTISRRPRGVVAQAPQNWNAASYAGTESTGFGSQQTNESGDNVRLGYANSQEEETLGKLPHGSEHFDPYRKGRRTANRRTRRNTTRHNRRATRRNRRMAKTRRTNRK
jgi:hypothetical protein